MGRTGDARGLSAQALEVLLARLGGGDAGTEAYESLRRTLQQFFTWRGAHDPDACADETLDRVAARLAGGADVERVRAFAYGVARLVLQEEYRRIAAQPAGLDERHQVVASADGDAEPRSACLDRCLDALPAADRDLVLRYYQHDHRARIEGRAALALALGLTAEALRTRVQRLRNRLDACVRRCVDDGEGV